MGMKDFQKSITVKGKFVCTGSFFFSGRDGETVTKVVKVDVPHPEMMCLIFIWPTMLSAVGGDFDDDDTVFTDIFAIDHQRMNSHHLNAGVWDHHFDEKGDDKNQGISSFVGIVNHSITLRLAITGDDWMGASYVVMEL
jgi:hypothetical protein